VGPKTFVCTADALEFVLPHLFPCSGRAIKSFCGGPGGSFFKKRPLVAEGKNILIPFSFDFFFLKV
jgi:hypothetical protein